MQFHWPSFLLGYGSGLATAVFAKRLRPVLVELGAMVQKLVDSAGTAVALRREELDDALAEGRARARADSPAAAPKRRPRAKRAAVRRAGAIRSIAPRRP